MRNPVGLFRLWGNFMCSYEKHVLTIAEQAQKLKESNRIFDSGDNVENFLSNFGFYRFRGYSFHLYDNIKREYTSNVKFVDIKAICQFDAEFSHLLFGILSSVEVSLRSHFVDALLSYKKDPLILYDPAIFEDKKRFWTNSSSLSQEIARSNDVFIAHNFQKHEGNIPVWAAVEVRSFGTLSRLIKNLKTGPCSVFSKLAENYTYEGSNNAVVRPTIKRLGSWIQACVILRNICAHNGRIYNRTFNTPPVLLDVDRLSQTPKYSGVYQTILAIKYLKPSNDQWNKFVCLLTDLLSKYSNVIKLKRIGFPVDWPDHLHI